jgi:hypothetical protein
MLKRKIRRSIQVVNQATRGANQDIDLAQTALQAAKVYQYASKIMIYLLPN